MAKKRTTKPKVLWAVDMKFREYSEAIQYPLYTIYQEGKDFAVAYYGVCVIQRLLTLEDAQEWVRSRIYDFKHLGG